MDKNNLLTDFKLEQAIGFHVNRTAFFMTEEITLRMDKLGYKISTQDFAILFRLLKKGAMTQIEIATLLMRDKTTITRRIDGLVKKGYVQRSPSLNDRRAVYIDLTALGHQALGVLVPLIVSFQQEVLLSITDEDKAITIKTLQCISNRLIDLKNNTGEKDEH
ncbi:MAG: MarR family transcriptional regulator [Mariprofundaceae bacterium]|nr:MarR family transcriptional regulator [Mariprofundaceae bacterium]